MDYRLFWVNEHSETLTGPISFDKSLKITTGQSESEIQAPMALVILFGLISSNCSEHDRGTGGLCAVGGDEPELKRSESSNLRETA